MNDAAPAADGYTEEQVKQLLAADPAAVLKQATRGEAAPAEGGPPASCALGAAGSGLEQAAVVDLSGVRSELEDGAEGVYEGELEEPADAEDGTAGAFELTRGTARLGPSAWSGLLGMPARPAFHGPPSALTCTVDQQAPCSLCAPACPAVAGTAAAAAAAGGEEASRSEAAAQAARQWEALLHDSWQELQREEEAALRAAGHEADAPEEGEGGDDDADDVSQHSLLVARPGRA